MLEFETAKTELLSYRKLYYVIIRKKQRLAELKKKFLAIKVQDFKERVQGGDEDRDWKTVLLSDMDELEMEIAEDITRAEKLARRIEQKIDALNYPYNEVLARKYIEFDTFEKIAVELNYDYRYVKKLHNRAINFYRIL